MNDRERFIRAIEADPEDDTVRLVFADWLEENGDPDRAQFIRLQVEHHRFSGSGKWGKLTQEIALLERHREEWTAGLPVWTRPVEFQRGFPHVWRMTGKQFLEGAAALRAAGPLPTLCLRLLKGREEAVFASEQLSGVSWLWVESAQLTDAGVTAVVSCPYLGRVWRLWASRDTFADAKDANKLTDAAAVALAEADNLPALTDLHLDGYKKITLAGVRALVESERRAGLTVLNVGGGPGGPAVAELFSGPSCRLTVLRELWLDDRKLGDAGVGALAGAAVLGDLRVLHVTQNKIGDRGAVALAGSPHLTELSELDLWKNGLTDAGVRTLLDSSSLRNVRRLQLGENSKLTDGAARAILADGRDWQKVGLDGTQVSAALKAEVAARCERSEAEG